jgi:oligogalacturonide transport system permease protein
MRPRLSLRVREALYGYGFIFLWLLGFAVFTFLALLETFRYSLHAVTVTATGIALSFVGWANYSRALFADPRFVELLIGYALETLLAVPIVLVFSMIIALMLNVRFGLRGLFRTIFFLPVIITSGPVIRELTAQGATAAPGLTDTPAVAAFLAGLPAALRAPTEYLLGSFILILWFSGVQILIYLASLQKVERSLYEAAAIDGASAWEAFWKITLPALSGATLINAVFTVIILSHFSENRVVRYIFERTYDAQGGIGYASATAFIYFGAMTLLLVAIYLVLGRGASKQ